MHDFQYVTDQQSLAQEYLRDTNHIGLTPDELRLNDDLTLWMSGLSATNLGTSLKVQNRTPWISREAPPTNNYDTHDIMKIDVSAWRNYRTQRDINSFSMRHCLEIVVRVLQTAILIELCVERFAHAGSTRVAICYATFYLQTVPGPLFDNSHSLAIQGPPAQKPSGTAYLSSFIYYCSSATARTVQR